MRWFVQQGWPVFPLRGKKPLAGSDGVKEATTSPATLQEWAGKYSNLNIGGACTHRLVIDLDPRNGADLDHDFPPTLTFRSGNGGLHLVYRLENNEQVKSGSEVLGKGIDIKTGPGSYIVLPTSIHPETGDRYEFVGGTEVALPPELYKRIQAAKMSVGGTGIGERSLLSTLLLRPPEIGSRNEWLAKVSGHYAKHYRKHRDLYQLHVELANQRLSIPLDDAEMSKTANSLWNMEHTGHVGRDFEEIATEDTGWLAADPGGRRLLTLGKLDGMGKNDPAIPIAATNFSPTVLGRILDPDTNEYTLDLQIRSTNQDEAVRVRVPLADLGDPRGLNRLLANYGLVLGCDGTPMIRSSLNQRLLRYLLSQPYPTYATQRYIGWSEEEGGYVLGDGVITKSGFRAEYQRNAPTPAVVEDTGRYMEFGFAESEEFAMKTLRRVCEFQDESTVAVFGAWWAARYARHLLERSGATLFPIVAIEASSGVGKTTGYFGLMNQLAGVFGGGVPTPAIARNRISYSQVAPVWIDDPDSTKPYMELFRAATQKAEVVKMNSTATNSVSFVLRAPIVVSGEFLDMSSEKAMIDRTVAITPPSPVGRMSKTNPKRPQLDDINALQADLYRIGPRVGGAAVAGHFLAWAARNEENISRVCAEMESTTVGRRGSVARTLLIGAVILDQMLDPTTNWKGGSNLDHVRVFLTPPEEPMPNSLTEDISYVDASFGWDNTLTKKILPVALRGVRDPNVVTRHEDGCIRFNVSQLAFWWKERNRGNIGRTESDGALGQQAKALIDMKVAEPNRTAKNRGYLLSESVSEVIYQRSLE